MSEVKGRLVFPDDDPTSRRRVETSGRISTFWPRCQRGEAVSSRSARRTSDRVVWFSLVLLLKVDIPSSYYQCVPLWSALSCVAASRCQTSCPVWIAWFR